MAPGQAGVPNQAQESLVACSYLEWREGRDLPDVIRHQ